MQSVQFQIYVLFEVTSMQYNFCHKLCFINCIFQSSSLSLTGAKLCLLSVPASLVLSWSCISLGRPVIRCLVTAQLQLNVKCNLRHSSESLSCNVSVLAGKIALEPEPKQHQSKIFLCPQTAHGTIMLLWCILWHGIVFYIPTKNIELIKFF